MINLVWTAVLVLFTRDSLTETLVWHADYARALKLVERHDRPLFIVFENGSSHFERVSSSGSFLNDQVEKALAIDYIKMYVDTETDEGQHLADLFHVTQFPRIVVIDRSGEWQVYSQSGAYTADDVLSVLGRYRRAKLTRTSSTILPSSYSTGPSYSTPLCRT